MGKILKILSGIVAGFALLFGFAWYGTSGLTDTADTFFNALKRQDVAQVRALLARETNEKLDDRALKKLMSHEAIASYSKASYSKRSVSGDRGNLEGTFTTTAGAVVPVQLVLVQEADTWKVYNFHAGR